MPSPRLRSNCVSCVRARAANVGWPGWLGGALDLPEGFARGLSLPVVDITDKDSADAAGDAFFWIKDHVLKPMHCRVDPTWHQCNESATSNHPRTSGATPRGPQF